MIFAFLFVVFIGVCAVALIGLEDSHYRVTRLLEELDDQAARHPEHHLSARTAQSVGPMVTSQPVTDAFGEMAFTRSLLALGKVDSLVPGDSPAPALDGSSSSVSVPLGQSKNHVPVL